MAPVEARRTFQYHGAIVENVQHSRHSLHPAGEHRRMRGDHVVAWPSSVGHMAAASRRQRPPCASLARRLQQTSATPAYGDSLMARLLARATLYALALAVAVDVGRHWKRTKLNETTKHREAIMTWEDEGGLLP